MALARRVSVQRSFAHVIPLVSETRAQVFRGRERTSLGFARLPYPTLGAPEIPPFFPPVQSDRRCCNLREHLVHTTLLSLAALLTDLLLQLVLCQNEIVHVPARLWLWHGKLGAAGICGADTSRGPLLWQDATLAVTLGPQSDDAGVCRT